MNAQFPRAIRSQGSARRHAWRLCDRYGRGRRPGPASAGYGYGGGGYGTAPASESELSIVNYLQVLYRRRYVASAAFLIVFLGAALYTLHVPRGSTRARCRMLIERDNPERRVVSGSARPGRNHRRLLRNAIPDSAEPRPGAANDRSAESLVGSAVQPSAST